MRYVRGYRSSTSRADTHKTDSRETFKKCAKLNFGQITLRAAALHCARERATATRKGKGKHITRDRQCRYPSSNGSFNLIPHRGKAVQVDISLAPR